MFYEVSRYNMYHLSERVSMPFHSDVRERVRGANVILRSPVFNTFPERSSSAALRPAMSMQSGYTGRVVFEWDIRKAVENIRKHNVSFNEATTVFGDFFGSTASAANGFGLSALES
jgi:hypothetical protein